MGTRKKDEPVLVEGSLGEKVDRLTERVTIAQEVAHRLRNAVIALTVLSLALAGGFFWLWNVADKANNAAEDAQAAAAAVKAEALVNCQNANEAREATRILWSFVLDASARPNPGEPPDTQQEVKFRQEFRDWVNELYAERDCSLPHKVHKIPPPPKLG